MSRLFYQTMQDNQGNLLFGVTGTMRLAGSGTLATIYGDEALTVILPNPMTNHPSYGSFKCFLGAGDYDFYMAKAGYTFETLTGVQGLGTMAQQDAHAVVLTGNEATPYAPLIIKWLRGWHSGLIVQPIDADMGTHDDALKFLNLASTPVGAITTSAASTAYLTSSDARLKHAVQTLVGELAVIRALRPVRFRWNVDDSEGVGFLAHEVAEHVQGVITGEADATDGEGRIVPQMIDASKLVPFLTGAVKTLAAQVEALAGRVHSLEEQLGVE